LLALTNSLVFSAKTHEATPPNSIVAEYHAKSNMPSEFETLANGLGRHFTQRPAAVPAAPVNGVTN
jgi:hypothetical protein